MKPVLSIGMIFKNDIRCLERCLKSLQPLRDALPCELIMADTGSTDGSQAIAEKYADVLFDFEWINDFSAARNATMERSRGAWYFFIDSDEWFAEGIEVLSSFLLSDLTRKYTHGYISRRDLLVENDSEQYEVTEIQRLVRLDCGARFKGRIHEHWDDLAVQRTFGLRDVVLWHDGYLTNNLTEYYEKEKRNLPLIEAELALHPDGPMLLAQAMDSAYTNLLAMKYARQAVDFIHRKNDTDPVMVSRLYRDSIRIALGCRMPELATWIREARQRTTDQIYTRVDISFYAASAAYQEQNWSSVRENVQTFLAGLHSLREQGAGKYGLTAGALNHDRKDRIEMAQIWLAEASARLGDWETCRTCLEKATPRELSVSNIGSWIRVAFLVWEHIDLAPIFRMGMPEGDDKLNELRRREMVRAAGHLFDWEPIKEMGPDYLQPEKPAFPLMAQLGDCDLAHAAKVMLAETAGELGDSAAAIRDWSELPYPVALRLLERDMPLPAAFYRQPVEHFEELAGVLVEKLDHGRLLALLEDLPDQDLKQRLWCYDLSVGAVREAKWDREKPEQLYTLYRLYAQSSFAVLNDYYNPVLLMEPEGYQCLPSLHGFGWCMSQAYDFWQTQDWTGVVRWLRQGLSVAPAMKKMVQFLLNRLEEERKMAQVSPELLALAEQVKAILAAYPADDSAVVELKQSELYQQVAYLIEE